jgi:hypothetical protein
MPWQQSRVNCQLGPAFARQRRQPQIFIRNGPPGPKTNYPHKKGKNGRRMWLEYGTLGLWILEKLRFYAHLRSVRWLLQCSANFFDCNRVDMKW